MKTRSRPHAATAKLFRTAAALLLLSAPMLSFGSAGNTTTKIIPPPNNPVTKLLTKYDTDHDGKLDRQELKQLKADNPTSYEEAMTFDKDHDGMLDAAETAAWKNSARN